MKTSFRITAVALLMIIGLAFVSCKKTEPLTADNSFTFAVLQVSDNFIYCDVYPKYNDVNYTAFLISSDELNRQGTTAVIDSVQAQLTKDKIYNTAKRFLFSDLQAVARYYICCYRLDSRNHPIYELSKKPQSTVVPVENNFNVNYSAEGTVIKVHPTTNDSYYWDYELKSVVDKDFGGNPRNYYYYRIYYYQNYEILEYLISTGEDREDAADFYPNLQAGDTLYMTAGFYDKPSGYYAAPIVHYAIFNEAGTFDFQPINPPTHN